MTAPNQHSVAPFEAVRAGNAPRLGGTACAQKTPKRLHAAKTLSTPRNPTFNPAANPMRKPKEPPSMDHANNPTARPPRRNPNTNATRLKPRTVCRIALALRTLRLKTGWLEKKPVQYGKKSLSGGAKSFHET